MKIRSIIGVGAIVLIAFGAGALLENSNLIRQSNNSKIPSVESIPAAETDAEIEERAGMVCLRLGNTTQAQHLERTNMIIEFGITDQNLVEITKGLIEAGFMLKQDNCVELLIEHLKSPLNK